MTEVKPQTSNSQIMLFTTSTCPNCRVAKRMLKESDIPYAVMEAEKNVPLVKEYEIYKAPTLVVVEDGKVAKYANLSEIKAFIDQHHI